jgi:hypothetical protein
MRLIRDGLGIPLYDLLPALKGGGSLRTVHWFVVYRLHSVEQNSYNAMLILIMLLLSHSPSRHALA